MLGVYLAVNGNNSKQVEVMQQTAEEWCEKMRAGQFSRHESWTSLNTTIWKSLEYPLRALTLTEDEYTYIMAPVLAMGLPNSRVCRSMQREVVYGGAEIPRARPEKNVYINGDRAHMCLNRSYMVRYNNWIAAAYKYRNNED